MELEGVKYDSKISLNHGDALIVTDVQNDFLPGGALETQEGHKIINGVNEATKVFEEADLPVVFTQDWHPEGHYSFAGAHEGKQPFDPYEAPGLGPVLWPDHCVQGTKGAEFAPNLNDRRAEAIIRKGYNPKIDSYSGFVENDHQTETGLDGYLKGRGVDRVFVCGLAFDYCVYFTVADAADKGYEVVLLVDLTQPVGAPENSIENARDAMQEKGVIFGDSKAVLG